MSTVGYGSIYTISDYCNAMMLLQSYINIALLAVITSALFVNFSRPKCVPLPSRVRSHEGFLSGSLIHLHICVWFQKYQNRLFADRAEDFGLLRVHASVHAEVARDGKSGIML